MTTIHKLCTACSRYFSGKMNGEYLCPDCRRTVRVQARPLNALDSMAPGYAPSTPRPPQAKGRAA